MQGSRVRPASSKKRHTKPCKFYQTMSCPLQADVCDFAHVLVTPNPTIRIDTICRYYQAGFCANGLWCTYAHSIEASPALMNAMNNMTIAGPNAQRRRSISHGALGYQGPSNGSARHSGIASAPGPSLGPTPILTNRTMASPPLATAKSFSGLPPHPPMAPPAYPDLIDDAVVWTEDPQMSEHSHSHQSRVYIADTTPPIHIPPYPNPFSLGPLSPQYQITSPFYTLEPKFVPFPLQQRKRKARVMSKKKLEKYKTKPCRFFGFNGVCPNGDSCTFLHDEDPRSIKRQFSPKKNKDMEQQSDERRSLASDDSNESAKLSTDQITDQDFCRVAAIAISGEDDESSFIGGSSTEEDEPPSSDSDRSKANKHRRRTRANSIPSRPSAAGHLSMETLFPAESPAVL